MGLFSKKSYICKQCGKEYEARIDLGGGLCSECLAKLREMENATSGYDSYAKTMGITYGMDELKAALLHRDGILEKYRITDGMTKEDLKVAGDNYKKLSEDEAVSIYKKARHQTVYDLIGAYFGSGFIGLTSYEGTVVDVKDVFAVAYTSVRLYKDTAMETILSAVFTNDPYIPVFGVITSGELGWFSMKSKSGRDFVDAFFSWICPNLEYPVMGLKKLKKIIKEEGCKGNIGAEDMLKYISDASSNMGVFKAKSMPDSISEADLDRLYSYGYVPDSDIKKLLKMDKIFAGSFWEKIAEKCD